MHMRPGSSHVHKIMNSVANHFNALCCVLTRSLVALGFARQRDECRRHGSCMRCT